MSREAERVDLNHRLVPSWRTAEAKLVQRVCQINCCLENIHVLSRELRKNHPLLESTFLVCPRHGSVAWSMTTRHKVMEKLPRKRLLIVDARLRLGEFKDTYEVDVNRHRAHLANKMLCGTGDPELVCGRTYQYGRGGWDLNYGKDYGQDYNANGGPTWTNLCPHCAWVVE